MELIGVWSDMCFQLYTFAIVFQGQILEFITCIYKPLTYIFKPGDVCCSLAEVPIDL